MIDTYFLYFSIYIDVCIYVYSDFVFATSASNRPHGACPVTAQALSQKTFPGSNRVLEKKAIIVGISV